MFANLFEKIWIKRHHERNLKHITVEQEQLIVDVFPMTAKLKMTSARIHTHRFSEAMIQTVQCSNNAVFRFFEACNNSARMIHGTLVWLGVFFSCSSCSKGFIASAFLKRRNGAHRVITNQADIACTKVKAQ